MHRHSQKGAIHATQSHGTGEYCPGYGKGGKHFSDEQDDYHQNPPWLNASAFQPDPSNPDLSGLWVERVPDTWEMQIERVKNELIASQRTVNEKTHHLGIVQVQKIAELGHEYGRDLHVLHTPIDDLPSHAEIRGVRPDDYILQQKLADAAELIPFS